jgi:hypothetical protein
MGARWPIVFRWRSGEISLGYLERFRWRIRSAEGTTEAADARAAAAAVLARIFEGVTPSREVAERAPIHVFVGAEASALEADERMFNGWTYASARVRFDVGAHDELHAFVSDLLSKNAERAWASGGAPEPPIAIGRDLSFEAFASAVDPRPLCDRLAAVLSRRVRSSPDPSGAFVAAMHELRALGHDLWSWDEDVWGADYVTTRPGAGLTISRTSSEGADDSGEVVEVQFRLPA